MNNYQNITNLAGDIPIDPLEYCLVEGYDAQFKHGAQGRTFGKYNRQCGIYMSNRCSQNWDGICEALSNDTTQSFPDMTNNTDGTCCQMNTQCEQGTFLKAGEILVKDTAYMKYLLNADNCNVRCEPFDPTAASSPIICYLFDSGCAAGQTNITDCGVLDDKGNIVPATGKKPCEKRFGLTNEQIKNIDRDPVINKIIARPYIAPELLTAIFIDAKEHGYAAKLRGTVLGRFYEYNGMQL
jgi:hypothetical protein